MMIPPSPTSTPPPDGAWSKPSVYSLGVIVLVFALIGYGLHAGKLTWTESLGAAVIGVLTWITKGARPPIADKIGGSKPPPPPPMFPPSGNSPLPTLTTPIRDPDRTPEGLPRMARIAGALVVVLTFDLFVAACPSPMVRPAAYGAELDACVETAKTQAQSQKCREDTARKYGRDAGAGDQ